MRLLSGPTSQLRNVCVLLFYVALSLSAQSGYESPRNDHLPHLDGAALLAGYPPEFFLTIGASTFQLTDGDLARDSGISPSMTSDGRVLAFWKGSLHSQFAATRSLLQIDARWNTHESLRCNRGSVSISPDGRRVSCQYHNPTNLHWSIQIINLDTEKVEMTGDWNTEPNHITWSPDGIQVAFDAPPQNEAPSWLQNESTSWLKFIHVFDLASNADTVIATGQAPAWSPSGDWIAFTAYVPAKSAKNANCYLGQCYRPGYNWVSLIKPDGSRLRHLMAFDSSVFSLAPVWSPDSSKILINKSHNAELATFDIFMLDTATGTSARLSKSTDPVYGWGVPRLPTK